MTFRGSQQHRALTVPSWRKREKLVFRGSSTAKNPETNRTVTKKYFFQKKELKNERPQQCAKKSSFFSILIIFEYVIIEEMKVKIRAGTSKF